MTHHPQFHLRRLRISNHSLIMILFLAGGLAWGQQSNPDAGGTPEGPDAPAVAPVDSQAASTCQAKEGANCVATPETDTGSEVQQPLRVGALDGSGLVELNSRLPRTLSLQLSTLGGYDTALEDKQGLNTGFWGGQGVVAKVFAFDRSSLLVQDAASVTSYRADSPTTVAYNQFSAALSSQLNETWNLQASAFTGYGNNALRTVAPMQQQPVGPTGGVAPDAASFGLYAGNVFTGQGSLSLHRQVSERSGWIFSGNDTNLHYFDPNTNQNTITGRSEYLHVATRMFTYGLYGVGIRQDGAIECSSGGGGLDIQYRPSRQVEVYASGGPVSGTGTCAHSLQILSSASLSVRPSQQTAFYFTANHRPNNGILPQTQWISSFTGGVDHAFNQRIEVTSDYAYSYGAASAGTPPLQESYVGASLKIVFAGSVWQTMSILHYANSGFSANPNRTIALFTLWWTPSILGNNSRHGGSI